MAKWKKEKDLNIGDIKSYKYEKDTRKNAVPVGFASYDITKLPARISLLPFNLDKQNHISIKVIDHKENEVMVVREIG